MMQIGYKYDDESIVLTVEGTVRGVAGRLFRARTETGDVDGWVAGDAARCDALGMLRMYGEDHPGTVGIREDRIFVTHAAVAALSAGQAHALGLPDRPPFVLSTDTSGVIGSPGFTLTARWLNAGQPIATRRRGAFLETSKGSFLIPDPLFSALELADRFDSGGVDLPEHWAALAEFRRLLDPESAEASDPIEMSGFLRGLRIYTGAAFSLTFRGEGDDLDFDPVLFDADAVQRAEEEGWPLTEGNGMLPAAMLKAFQQHQNTGFRAFESAKRSYLLSSNTYLIVDNDLETVLQVVREKQQADPADRQAFAANPRAVIAERLAEQARGRDNRATPEDEEAREEEIENRAASLFIETPEYVDRAIGIGLWEEPNLEFLPHTPNVWLPETFAVELGGVWIRLDADAVVELRTKVDEAIRTEQPEVDYRGERVPATPEVRDKLAQIVGTETPKTAPSDDESDSGATDDEDDSGQDDEDNSRTPSSPIVVLVRNNFVEENWSPQRPPREARIPSTPPSTVGTRLMDHQQRSLEWQIDAWQAGHLGILNADDQGLGKTLQTLAFLAWLQEHMAKAPQEKRQPALIVAPTGLLRTWEAEVKKHLTETGLGARIDVYGRSLRALRIPGSTGKDTDDGHARLAFRRLFSAIEKGNGHRWWLLTTYETLANYQHSFRQIEFSVVVFDEIQKIKNVRTLIALAARAVKADFRIGLTGTPIENHVSDLWAIMDALTPGESDAPGRLGTLHDYMGRYRMVTKDSMGELHARLFKPVKNGDRHWPPVAQRRFKESEIAGLPRKDYRLYPSVMPDAQAEAYENARRHLVDGARGAALKLLHHIRGVSLHPQPPEVAQGEIDAYFACAARLEAMRNVLARVHERNERALIFTEDRRMQAFVAQWLRSEFALQNVRIINGATTIARRKQYVAEFQRHLETDRGFDVLILSPRAAGVGLTLTAATHVIHLSRWWNPAVEEQCNDRIYRIGQERDVTVHLPLAIHPAYRERSFDCVLNDLMRRKNSLARAALWPPTDSDFDNGMLVTGVSGAEPLDPAEIDDQGWTGFEDWVMDRARESDDWEVSQTPRSGDRGADAILRSRHRRPAAAVVQAKHTTDRKRLIGETAVHEVLRAAGAYNVQNPQLVVITNARGFTDGARRLALQEDVKLVDRDRLGLWPSHVLG